jgi:hypothetical protein
MSTCARKAGEAASSQPASTELRRAQRAHAALIDAHGRVGEFRGAQMRSAARRTLSALSADDRTRLADWLSLLLAADRRATESALALIARLDMGLAARVQRRLPERVEALAAGDGASNGEAA